MLIRLRLKGSLISGQAKSNVNNFPVVKYNSRSQQKPNHNATSVIRELYFPFTVRTVLFSQHSTIYLPCIKTWWLHHVELGGKFMNRVAEDETLH